MIYHVLPGDAIVEEFKKAGIDGEPLICRECLIVGDADAETLHEFWEQRARFIMSEYGEDEIEYYDKVAEQLSKLLDLTADDEVDLWFEYELFCSVNMWFCLSLLSQTDATVYRVEPAVLSREDRWSGFGKLSASDLKKCFDQRTKLTPDDLTLGTALWNAFRTYDYDRLTHLSTASSAAFPYLAEVCAAATEKDTRPAEIIAEIEFEGKKDFDEILAEFTRRAGVFGLGDLQVQRLVDQ
jgi:hypothetical protein